MVCDTPPFQDAITHEIWNPYLKEYRRYAPDSMQFLETSSEVMFKVTVTQLWYRTLRHPKMHPRTKFWDSYIKNYKKYDPDTIILKTWSKVKVIVTWKWYVTLRHPMMHSHQIWKSYLKEYKRYAPYTIILKTRSEVKVKIIVTRKWYMTLCHPNMHLHIKFGIPISKNIGICTRLNAVFRN